MKLIPKKAAVFLTTFVVLGLMMTASVSADSISLSEFLEIEDSLRPVASVDEETQTFDIEPIFQPDDRDQVIGFRVPSQTLDFNGGSIAASEGFATLFDPVIVAPIAVIDTGTPSSFAVAVASPLFPPFTTPVTVQLDIAGSFADGGTNGGSATAFLTPKIAQATIEGVGVADAGDNEVFVTPIDTYGPYSSTTVFDCTALPDGKCDSFDLLVSFTGSGRGDAIAFTARHEITKVPEPTAFLFATIACMSLSFVTRRRSSRA